MPPNQSVEVEKEVEKSVESEKIEQPENHYESPTEVANDRTLTNDKKMKALDTWEQDARQMLVASNEGMPEGLDPRLGEVISAKEEVVRAKGENKRSGPQS